MRNHTLTQAEIFLDSPEMLAGADAATVGKLITIHFRNESLNPGHIATQIDNGHWLALMRRITELD
jgi:hypothetical protein